MEVAKMDFFHKRATPPFPLLLGLCGLKEASDTPIDA